MLATTEVTQRGQVTIPIEIRNALNLKTGTKVLIAQSSQFLLFIPAKTVRKSDVMSLYGSLTPRGKKIDIDNAIEKSKILKAKDAAET